MQSSRGLTLFALPPSRVQSMVKKLQHCLDTALNAVTRRVQHQIGLYWRFVRRGNPAEILYFACSGALIQAFDIALFTGRHVSVAVNLEKMPSGTSARARRRSSMKGEMKAVSTMVPA